MKLSFWLSAKVLLLLCLLSPQLASAEKVLLEERSLYSTVRVQQTGNLICLLFNVGRDQRNQSCINTKRPREMVFAYTRMSMSALLFNPDPKRVLVVGLGGGTLPTALHEIFPNARIDAIEIDPVVVKVAQQFFGLELSEQLKVHTQDARIWTRRAQLRNDKFDIVILDAFNGEYIPEHLMTREFFQELRSMLTENGVLVSNTFAISDLYDHESATYADVFGAFINFQIPESANRVVLAPLGTVSDTEIRARSEQLRSILKPYNVPIGRYSKNIIRQRKADPDWDQDARVLTDQYSPANLLRQHN